MTSSVSSTPAERHAAKGLNRLTAAMPDIIHKVVREVLSDKYTPELADAIAADVVGMLTGSICPVYPGVCTETEPGHYDHSNHDHRVRDKQGETILDVGFVQVSDGGPAVIYIGGLAHEDYAPQEVRAKTAEIRRLLDEADAMADKVMAAEAVRGQVESAGVQA
jgi:hypothetical protein